MQDGLLASGHVRCAAVDIPAVHLTTSGDDKVLKVWKIDGLQLLSSRYVPPRFVSVMSPQRIHCARELPKKPTGIRFLRDGQTILVSDKFGDIFSYPVHSPDAPLQSESKSRRDAMTSHENSSGGTLILGHTSVVTSFVLSADERYVISADRDEHVRVSWYPQGWHVEIFCLGHEK
jgi:tRNA (guanine-N(7)-)-methyltransferase subunit TRM82